MPGVRRRILPDDVERIFEQKFLRGRGSEPSNYCVKIRDASVHPRRWR